jgi:hypothetical protein
MGILRDGLCVLMSEEKSWLAQLGRNYSENTRKKFTREKVHPIPVLIAVRHAFEITALHLHGRSCRRQRPINRLARFRGFITHPSTIHWK